MHEQGARLGQRHQFVVHLIGRERLTPHVGLRFLAHRRPGVGVNGVDACYRIDRFVEQTQPRAVVGHTGRLLHNQIRQMIPLGTGDVEVDPKHRGSVGQGCRYVVAIAHVRDRSASE